MCPNVPYVFKKQLSDFREKRRILVISQQPAANQKAKPQRDFQRKTSPAPGHYIYGQVRVLPIFILIRAHIKWAVVDVIQQHIRAACNKLALWKTHGRRAIAAATALMKHEWAVRFAQAINDLRSCLGQIHSFYFFHV